MCPPVISPERLCAVLGMPDYFNSTNLSAPYALYAVAAVAVLVHGGLSRIDRVLFSSSAAILAAALILTGSRGGYVAAALGCGVLAVCGPRWSRLAIATAGVLAVAAVAVDTHLRDLLLARGLSYRPELWSAYLAMAFERPLTGVGILGNINMPMHDGYVVDQPHNLVLSGFVRGGIVGALAMAATIAASIYYALRYWLATRNAIPLALIVTMFGYGMLDYQLLATYPTWPWITFWFPIGVCAGIETALKDAAQLDPAAVSSQADRSRATG
jgi:O-antigen ligase